MSSLPTMLSLIRKVAAGMTTTKDAEYLSALIQPWLHERIVNAYCTLMADPEETRRRIDLQWRRDLARELTADLSQPECSLCAAGVPMSPNSPGFHDTGGWKGGVLTLCQRELNATMTGASPDGPGGN